VSLRPLEASRAHRREGILRAMRSGLAAVLLLLVAPACAREQTPGAAYRAFVKAAADRDAERVWGMLSRDSQARLEARARAAAAEAPRGVVPASAKQLVLGDAELAAPPLASVVVLRESADRAILRVTLEGGASHEVTLVREGGWRVDVAAASEAPAPVR
jgi:hypothetical protein